MIPLADSVSDEPAGTQTPSSRSTVVTASDWGTVGLLQMPSARMAKAGTFNFTFSHVQPYSRGNIFVQPFDWLEAGFRYSDISNRPRCDRGAEYRPEPQGQELRRKNQAVGRIGVDSSVLCRLSRSRGTGLFSGEYVVGSKRTGAFDWTLGLGWGYVGGRGNLRNPLGVLGSKFDARKPLSAEGGTPLFGSYFRGPTRSVRRRAISNALGAADPEARVRRQRLPARAGGNNQKVRSPWNLGLVYRTRWVDLSLAVERGNKVMLGLTFFTGWTKRTCRR
jgi:hypothetical protein